MNFFRIWKRRLRFFKQTYGLYQTSKKARIVIAAGMPRSGSTWLFNATKLLLEENGEKNIWSGWIGDFKKNDDYKVIIIKLHLFDPLLLLFDSTILYSFRDVRDALASRKRKFKRDPTLEHADFWIEMDADWRKYAHFNMKYEDMMMDQLGTLEKLVDTLSINPSVDKMKILEKISLNRSDNNKSNKKGYQKDTLLHNGHVTNGGTGVWHDWIPTDILHAIEKKHANWFADNEYPAH